MTQSESARATSAAEARYRIDAPNSQPRTVKVIALDAAAERVVKRIAQGSWRRATFFTSLSDDGAPRGAWSMQAWLGDVAGRAIDLVAEIASADLIVMVAAAGGSTTAAERTRWCAGSTPGGVTSFSISALTARSSRWRAMMMPLSVETRFSLVRSTIGPMLSCNEASCIAMPSTPL